MTTLVLDRIEIEEVGANSERLAEAIHRQLGTCQGPVPVHDIAKALDITEIREEPLINFEAALLTTMERGYGSMLVNLTSSRQRRRYSVGHELLHFLNPWHEPTSPQGFQCSREDMLETGKRAGDVHRTQEGEANRFAIELLAPPARVRPYLVTEVDLANVLAMAEDLDISREAAARRYIALHNDRLAVLFAKNGLLRYADLTSGFPRLCVQYGQPVPVLPPISGARNLSPIDEVDADDWVQRADGSRLWAQILRQQDGFATILLRVSGDEENEESELEDTFERFAQTESRRDLSRPFGLS